MGAGFILVRGKAGRLGRQADELSGPLRFATAVAGAGSPSGAPSHSQRPDRLARAVPDRVGPSWVKLGQFPRHPPRCGRRGDLQGSVGPCRTACRPPPNRWARAEDRSLEYGPPMAEMFSRFDLPSPPPYHRPGAAGTGSSMRRRPPQGCRQGSYAPAAPALQAGISRYFYLISEPSGALHSRLAAVLPPGRDHHGPPAATTRRGRWTPVLEAAAPVWKSGR